MKTNVILILIQAISILMCSSASQAYELQLGTNMIGVAFADPTLSASTKEIIVSDLHRCVEFWGERTLLRLGSNEPFVGYADNPTLFPYYREGLKMPNDLVSNQNGGVALYIPANLLAEYTNAIAFANVNSNIVSAADVFVEFVSSTNFMTISSNQMVNFVLQKNTSPEYYAQNHLNILSELHDQQFYRPSILGFYYSEEGPASSNLWVNIPCTLNLGYSTPTWTAFPAIWHDGKWKFCLWDATE